MPHTIESVFNDNSLIRKVSSEYKFRVGEISTVVTIRLKPLDNGKVIFEQSHFIHTPTQAGPYETDYSYGDYEAYALHLPIAAYGRYYQDAVKAGHKPDVSWLVANSKF